MTKLWQFLQSHPKSAFSEKVQRVDQGKFFKNRPKSSPRSKGPKALRWKWHYPLMSMLLKCNDWRRFWRKKRLKEYPNCQVMAIFAWSTKTRIFWNSLKGGPREIFQKSPKKLPSFERHKSTPAETALSSIQYAIKVQRLGKILAQKAAQRVPELPSYGIFCKITQNQHFLKKCKGGTKENFSKIG